MTAFARILPLCTLGLGMGLGFAWFGARPALPPESPGRDDAALSPSPTTARPVPAALAPPPPPPPAPPATEPPAPASTLAPGEDAAPALTDATRSRLHADIEAAYTTYDVAALPKLTPHLRHPDPEIRAFARDAIIQLGHAEGAAPLRAAARAARDPHEAAALEDAAAFLELPPAPVLSADSFPPVARQAPAPASPAPSS